MCCNQHFLAHYITCPCLVAALLLRWVALKRFSWEIVKQHELHFSERVSSF